MAQVASTIAMEVADTKREECSKPELCSEFISILMARNHPSGKPVNNMAQHGNTMQHNIFCTRCWAVHCAITSMWDLVVHMSYTVDGLNEQYVM